jgi:hypothetical protein
VSAAAFHTEWPQFLRQIDRETPGQDFASGLRQLRSRRTEKSIRFTPTSASWLNMIERFFCSISTDRLLPRLLRAAAMTTKRTEAWLRLPEYQC